MKKLLIVIALTSSIIISPFLSLVGPASFDCNSDIMGSMLVYGNGNIRIYKESPPGSNVFNGTLCGFPVLNALWFL